MKIIQCGEGNFLRTFVDLYFDSLNKENLGQYEISIIKSIPFGSLENFKIQNNKYHVVLRGRKDNKDVEEIYQVDSINSAIDLFVDSDPFFLLAEDKEVKLLISNTTEAGIVFNNNDLMDKFPNISYPGKLTMWLYRRYKKGLPGIYLLPVELIENNADALYKAVDDYISLWGLEEEFRIWNNKENYYCNTLVDRIVSGYPKDEKTKNHLDKLIGQEDKLLSIGEPFGLWVIQNKGDIKKYIIDGHHNIDVLLTEDISYYKKRKVRVLNGSHTNLVPISLWMGKITVYDVMNDDKLLSFVKNTLKEDIIPFVGKDIKASESFANDVLERFLNPYLNHQLTSIALNSISKWKARDLCSFIDYYRVNNKIPHYLTIGLAYLINMYQHIEHIDDKYICHLPNRDIIVNDEEKYLKYFNNHNVKDFLSDKSIWGIDLLSFDNLLETINGYLKDIKEGKAII